MFAILLKVLNANGDLYHDLNFQGTQAMYEYCSESSTVDVNEE